jgi:nucleoside-diphosphate-sugar epimerase
MAGRVLVTGISGFTGRYLRGALERRGYAVHGVAESVSRASDCAVNLLDRAALARAVKEIEPRYVVHLAGVANVAHDHAEDFYRIHAVGTSVLLEELGRSGLALQKIVLASSANVYGRPQRVPVRESEPIAPVSHYGASKAAMEALARTWFDRLPILIARPFNYTGVGQSLDFVLPKLAEHFRRRAPEIELGELAVTRELNDVRDVAEAYASLLECEAAADVVNLCSGRGHRLDRVFQQLCSITGHTPKVHAGEALRRRNEIPELVGSPEKLAGWIGAIPARPLEETLRWMLEG